MLQKADIAILSSLENQARLSLSDMGSNAEIRVQALEKTGVIRGYRTLIDPVAIGLYTIAFLNVGVDFEEHTAFEREVSRHAAIISCHSTIGDADYLLRVMTPSMADLDYFIHHDLWRLPGVQRFTTTMAMRSIKEDGSLIRALTP